MINQPTLPILSLESLSTASPPALSALHAACHQTGFFYLTDHGIPAAKLAHILALTRTFFLHASPADKAALARRDPDYARGYQRIGENVTLGKKDAHEAVDLYAPWRAKVEGQVELKKKGDGGAGILTGENLWPSTPVELRKEVEGYVKEVKKVGMEVVRVMALALGLREGDGEWEGLVGQVTESFWVMRLIGYPPLGNESEGISCGEHTGMFLPHFSPSKTL
jgi:isopenicillin N synthase-like dioxygenase